MKEQYTIHEAKTHLSKLIKRAVAGEEIIIAKGKTPLVKLVVVAPKARGRRMGGAQDLVEFISDDFDAPLEEFDAYAE